MATKKSRKKQTSLKEQQNRREMIALLCIVISIFALLCCFETDAFLLAPSALFIGGLFGQVGRYVLPFVLFYAGIILFMSRGKSVRLRITATLAIVLTVSAIVHLFIALISGDDVGLSIGAL